MGPHSQPPLGGGEHFNRRKGKCASEGWALCDNCYFSQNASVQWQPGDLTTHTKVWFIGAGFLAAPPVSLSLARATVQLGLWGAPLAPSTTLTCVIFLRQHGLLHGVPAWYRRRFGQSQAFAKITRSHPFERPDPPAPKLRSL